MLVSSIGYLETNKNIKSASVKNKNIKNNSRFGQVQTQVNHPVYNNNYFKNFINSIKSVFSNKNNIKDSKLSVIA